ncbi:MAG: hypothetical protein WBW84_11815 [Acidobacteriaceae bacterium]
MLNRIATLVWPGRFAFASRTQVCIDLSRLLLGLAFVELLTMPITQHFWTWDHFLRGGQDFELGLFVIVSCLCLVLLRAQHCQQKVRLILAFCCLLFVRFRPRLFTLLATVGVSAAVPDPPLGPRPAGVFCIPLQI